MEPADLKVTLGVGDRAAVERELAPVKPDRGSLGV